MVRITSIDAILKNSFPLMLICTGGILLLILVWIYLNHMMMTNLKQEIDLIETQQKEQVILFPVYKALLKKDENIKKHQMIEYNWTEITKKYIEHNPSKSIALADKILKNLGKDGTIFNSFHSHIFEVLDLIFSRALFKISS